MKTIEHLKKIIENAENKPGVYRFLNESGKILYVGKAKNLKNRLRSYMNLTALSKRLQKMILESANIITIKTQTESEALLLETDWIKEYNPPYNILMKDDKSFPYLALSNHDYPRLFKYRGKKKKGIDYFGPYASVQATNETIKLIQKVFQIRTCSDTFFKNRTRPCILYEIKRCSGPCCQKIKLEDYKNIKLKAIDFLSGKTTDIIKLFSEKMKKESEQENYERALYYRDSIEHLNTIFKQGKLNIFENKTADLITLYQQGKAGCISVFKIQNGLNIGQTFKWLSNIEDLKESETLEQFLPLFYSENPRPKNVFILEKTSADFIKMFEETFSLKIHQIQKGEKKKYLTNLQEATKNEFMRKSKKTFEIDFKNLEKIFKFQELKRIDVFDNSHLSGTNAVGAMIVASPNGFEKELYRKFKLDNIKSGNDLDLMKEVLTRRYTRAKTENTLPDLILIDGGRTQLNITNEVLKRLDLENINVLTIAKGENRNAGKETIYAKDGTPHHLIGKNLYFLEQLRDEVHRFVISFQRHRRRNKNFESELDKIKGIGSQKRQKLLNHFGSIKNIEDAKIKDLQHIEGIDLKIAEKIYKFFHE
ncbi:MAG: excinuclease ABC subunit UvrC [Alphaproteobacteria bacterium]|nr:excinuclease ABC subunit UvrC [Alphaproteobacteria bacterium]